MEGCALARPLFAAVCLICAVLQSRVLMYLVRAQESQVCETDAGVLAAAPAAAAEELLPRSHDIDLSAPIQRLSLHHGVCHHGLWTIGECQNAAIPPAKFLCLVHASGVQITLGQFSGGSFRGRGGDTSPDTLFFRDGSSKPAEKSTMKNVSPSELFKLRRVAEEDTDQVRALQQDVIYEYGDHWRLCIVNDDIEVNNDHIELMIDTHFDGRPISTATPRYPGTSRPTIQLAKGSQVSFTNAWGVVRPIFTQNKRSLVLHVSSTDENCAAYIDGMVTVELTVSYLAQLLARLASKLGLPEGSTVKLMYADPDFGELCLLTNLNELEDDCEVTVKLVERAHSTQQARSAEQQKQVGHSRPSRITFLKLR